MAVKYFTVDDLTAGMTVMTTYNHSKTSKISTLKTCGSSCSFTALNLIMITILLVLCCVVMTVDQYPFSAWRWLWYYSTSILRSLYKLYIQCMSRALKNMSLTMTSHLMPLKVMTITCKEEKKWEFSNFKCMEMLKLMEMTCMALYTARLCCRYKIVGLILLCVFPFN